MLGVGKSGTLKMERPTAFKSRRIVVADEKAVDFNRGLAELTQAVREQRPCRLLGKLGLHVLEIIEVLQYPERLLAASAQLNRPPNIDPIQPLPCGV